MRYPGEGIGCLLRTRDRYVCASYRMIGRNDPNDELEGGRAMIAGNVTRIHALDEQGACAWWM